MSLQSIEDIFKAFDRLKILVIGDVMIDSYVWGNVSRISPEAPVPIVNVKSREKRLGGAANVALNLQSLGAEPILCSVLGDDDDSGIFINLLEKRRISSRGLVKSKDRITTVKERVLVGSQHLLRVDSESLSILNAAEEESLQLQILQLLPEVDAVIFEDYDKGTITASIIEQTIKAAKEQKVPTIVDPKRNNFFHYKGVDLFKPNLKELKEGLNTIFEQDDMVSLQTQTSRLRELLNAGFVMTTLSEKGVYIQGEKEDHLVSAHKRSISDVSGAGDTVVSIAGLCMALKLSPYFTASLANLGGGIVCEELGVVPIGKQRLLEEALKNKLKL
ncbi:D-glycero-beta-D-manno-heptose-7-phosphate kinase [Marivirga sp. S37H4]|uniref:D-glycero-beta-D-manno-heptose-7-phosphate kinase n=1 Tax=Marivirga aurantiaca TaxID=2802615 RepID=A0A935CAX4_9BACT|nr:bifunctional ADP-heptose synthase [Marivirga aurantiaca]MBK6266845.1 D-glycero-beta-D-manno-heptose-7-phosphate kinase [Marivirga aurantiaca]